jgi:hypothetical protein
MSKTFRCECCDFTTTVKANFVRHNSTAKHLTNLEGCNKPETIVENKIENKSDDKGKKMSRVKFVVQQDSALVEQLRQEILGLQNENMMLKHELALKSTELQGKVEVIQAKDEFIAYMKNLPIKADYDSSSDEEEEEKKPKKIKDKKIKDKEEEKIKDKEEEKIKKDREEEEEKRTKERVAREKAELKKARDAEDERDAVASEIKKIMEKLNSFKDSKKESAIEKKINYLGDYTPKHKAVGDWKSQKMTDIMINEHGRV